MTPERLENIRRMEEILNRTESFLQEANCLLQRWEALRPDTKRLEKYYYSKQWRKDHEASNREEIPEGMSHGVLSEDAIYNLLGEEHFTALAFLKHITKIIARE